MADRGSPSLGGTDAAVKRAAWVYALRSGWSESERLDLAEAEQMVREILDAYEGRIDRGLLDSYGHELDEGPGHAQQ